MLVIGTVLGVPLVGKSTQSICQLKDPPWFPLGSLGARSRYGA